METLLNVETPLSQSIFEQINVVKKDYMKSPILWRMNFNKQLSSAGSNVKVTSVEFTKEDDCEFMNVMLDSLEALEFVWRESIQKLTGAKLNEEMEKVVTVTAGMIHSQVNHRVKVSPRILFNLGDNHIGLTLDEKGLNISRVWVSNELHGNGFGTVMMTSLMFVLETIAEYHQMELPNISLECVGSVGLGDNQMDTPLEVQTKFFSKFGFETSKKIYKKENGKNELVEVHMNLKKK